MTSVTEQLKAFYNVFVHNAVVIENHGSLKGASIQPYGGIPSANQKLQVYLKSLRVHGMNFKEFFKENHRKQKVSIDLIQCFRPRIFPKYIYNSYKTICIFSIKKFANVDKDVKTTMVALEFAKKMIKLVWSMLDLKVAIMVIFLIC